ncbi:MAG: diguanylate cyclase, partial [Campylobacterales bacterium]|nr:diguanylate cyclase [Campylobacterales bacterium]
MRILFFVSFFILSLFGNDKNGVLILHSYSQEYSWTKQQHNSFISTLATEDKSFEYFTEYLDTKRVHLTKQYQKDFLSYLQLKYKDADIDMVYVTDDNALTFIYNVYETLFKKNIPVFFSGVNDLSMDNKLPKDIYAGVYEIKEIKPNIELIKQFSPQTRDIYFLGDNSNTYHSIQKEIE